MNGLNKNSGDKFFFCNMFAGLSFFMAFLVLVVVIVGVRVRSFAPEIAIITDSVKHAAQMLSVKKTEKMAISSGVVPHHLLAGNIIENFFKRISSLGEPDTIILIGPDHFKAGAVLGDNIISLRADTERFYGLETDKNLIKNLSGKNKFSFSDSAAGLDHSIANFAPFLKRYFPRSKIMPLLAPFGVSEKDIRLFAESLNEAAPENAIVIASVDFSHYLPASASAIHDAKSIRTLLNFEKESFRNIDVDSWQSLYIARYFSELRKKSAPEIIGRNNSDDFAVSGVSDSGTSYFSVIFGDKDIKKADFPGNEKTAGEFGESPKTFLFAGDIMLDRGVEYFTNKNSIDYSFGKIDDFLKGVDAVFGNLEGPIVKKTKDFPDDSLQFAFDKKMAGSLGRARFDILSLANNHTLNMGQKGLEETKVLLKDAGVGFAGDPIKCSEDFAAEKDGMIFLSFNKTFSYNCGDEDIIKTIKAIKAVNPEKFIAVSVHWGNEYQLKSNILQQKLAHGMIDAGSDLIIGTHPHVVQEIEKYKGKMIFYSLGNFIFDQSFSKETQTGLSTGLEMHSGYLVYRLFPIEINKGQPFLMKTEDTAKFLEALSKRSGEDLRDNIKLGIIKIYK